MIYTKAESSINHHWMNLSRNSCTFMSPGTLSAFWPRQPYSKFSDWAIVPRDVNSLTLTTFSPLFQLALISHGKQPKWKRKLKHVQKQNWLISAVVLANVISLILLTIIITKFTVKVGVKTFQLVWADMKSVNEQGVSMATITPKSVNWASCDRHCIHYWLF